MNKIHLEKENIGRIILKVPLFCLFAACFYFFLFEERKIFPLIISVVGFVIVGFSIFSEVYECIFYDETHFRIRSLGGKKIINYSDIEKIKREFIRPKTVLPGGYWRYTVQVKNQDDSEQIITSFPQSIENVHFKDLLTKINQANSKVQYVNF